MCKAENLSYIQEGMPGTPLGTNTSISAGKWVRPMKMWVSSARVNSFRTKVRWRRWQTETNPELANKGRV